MAYNLYQNPLESLYRPEDEEAAYEARRPTLSALLPKPDPDMDERWREAEQSALERSQPNTEYGWAEGVRDFAPMAIGSLLDILVNKGRGLGTLAAGGMQALGDEQARRDALQKNAAAQALAIRQQRESGADRAINAEHAMLRAAELEQRIAEMKAKSQKAMSPEAQQKINAEIDLLKAQAEKARADAEYAGMDDIMKAITSADAGTRRAGEDAYKKRKLDIEDRRVTAQEALAKQQQADRDERIKNQRRDKFNQQSNAEVPLLRELRGMDQLIQEAEDAGGSGAAVPGLGADAYKPMWALSEQGKKMRVKHDAAKETLTRLLTKSAGSEAEYARIRGLLEQLTAADTALAIRNFRDLVAGKLRSYGAGNEDVAREILDAAEPGLYDYALKPGVSKAPPKQYMVPGDQPSRPAAPSTPAAPIGGGVMPSGAQLFKDPAQAQAFDQLVTRMQGMPGFDPASIQQVLEGMRKLPPEKQLPYLRATVFATPLEESAGGTQPGAPAAPPTAAPEASAPKHATVEQITSDPAEQQRVSALVKRLPPTAQQWALDQMATMSPEEWDFFVKRLLKNPRQVRAGAAAAEAGARGGLGDLGTPLTPNQHDALNDRIRQGQERLKNIPGVTPKPRRK